MKISMIKKFNVMKNKKVIGLTLIALMLSGCSSFLNQKPQSFVSSSTFYQTPSQIGEALNGVYHGLQIIYGARNGAIANSSSFWAMTEERSDNTTFEYNNANRGALMREQMDYFLVTPDNTYSRGVWAQTYHTIAQANSLLSKIKDVKYSKAAEKNQVIGQAEFIRALLYFNLVRLYANVPLVLNPVTSPNQTTSIKQSKPAEVYAQIIKDATDAASKLPAKWTGNDKGRATQGAANTLLGDVYLTQHKYKTADSYFQKVISSGDYALLANYANLWDTKHKNSLESVFEIQYSGATTNAYSNFLYTFAPINSASVTTGFPLPPAPGRNIPTRNMEKAYQPGDLRYKDSIAWFVDPSNTQWAEAQHDSIPYINKYATQYAVPNKQDNDFYVYRYAQVLLWDAEAQNEINGAPTSQSYQYVNMVRQRAGLNNLATGMSKSQFETAVWHEERVEGAFEDHRWFQLLRTGRAISVMTANGAEQKKYQTWLSSGAYIIKPYKLLYPIPQHDLMLQNYTQNPGW